MAKIINLTRTDGNWSYITKGSAKAMQDRCSMDGHPATPEQVASLVDAQYQYAERALGPHYARIIESYLWFIGQHHLQIDDASRRFVSTQSTGRFRIPRPVINLILEKVESIAGDLGKGVVAGHVLPNSRNPVDRLGARSGEIIRSHLWEQQRMGDKQDALIQGHIIAGDMLTFTEIDADASETTPVAIGRGQDGDDVTFAGSMGDVKTTTYLPIQFFPNPSAPTIEDARWLHIHYLQSTEYICEQYPKVRDLLSKDEGRGTLASWQYRIQELVLREAGTTGFGSLFANQTGLAAPDIEKQLVVHKVLFKPDSYYPQGRMFITAGKACLWAGPLPLEVVAATKLGYTPVEGSFWSLGLVRFLKHLVQYIESEVSHNIMARKVAAVPMIWAPKQARGAFMEGELEIEPAGIYRYTPGPRGEKPEMVQGNHPADAGYIASINLFLQEFIERISGAKQVLVGERPQGISAGIAIRQLIQRASVRFAPKLARILREIELRESYRLKAITKAPAWVMPRQLPYPGRASQRSFGYFRAADMRDNWTYKIEAGPKDLQDEATIAQLTFEGAKAGFIDLMDPAVATRNRRQARKNIGLADAGFIDIDTEDLDYAEYVLAEILSGNTPSIVPIANFKSLIGVAASYMKTEDYQTEPPHIQKAVMDYILECQTRLQIVKMGAMMGQARDEEMASVVSGVAEERLPQVLPDPAFAGPAMDGGGMGGPGGDIGEPGAEGEDMGGGPGGPGGPGPGGAGPGAPGGGAGDMAQRPNGYPPLQDKQRPQMAGAA